MKIKTLGRYALDMLRGQAATSAGSIGPAVGALGQANQNGYISPYQNATQFDAQTALGAMNTQGMGNVFYTGNGGNKQFEPLPPPDLEAGAWAAAISELENLWLVKFGSKWVHAPELDEFYQVACERLIKVKKMESHHITSISTPVYRIIE